MGRSSLLATKLLCSLMVRDAVDFLRGACPFFELEDPFFVLLEGGFFLLAVEPLFLLDV
jgi:hypothetical protein